MKKGKKGQWDLAAAATDNAQARLPAMAEKYFAKGRKLLSGKPSEEQLHRFQVKTEFLRNSIELFTDCYGQDLKRCLSDLRRVQTFLGDINDRANTRQLIAKMLPGDSADRKKIERNFKSRSRKLEAQLRRYWKGTLDKQGQLEWWLDLLAGKDTALPAPKLDAPAKSRPPAKS